MTFVTVQLHSLSPVKMWERLKRQRTGPNKTEWTHPTGIGDGDWDGKIEVDGDGDGDGLQAQPE